ncbi:hypothetical protein GGH95_002995, partial [Coemansia sp. RSA 1836]
DTELTLAPADMAQRGKWSHRLRLAARRLHMAPTLGHSVQPRHMEQPRQAMEPTDRAAATTTRRLPATPRRGHLHLLLQPHRPTREQWLCMTLLATRKATFPLTRATSLLLLRRPRARTTGGRAPAREGQATSPPTTSAWT